MKVVWGSERFGVKVVLYISKNDSITGRKLYEGHKLWYHPDKIFRIVKEWEWKVFRKGMQMIVWLTWIRERGKRTMYLMGDHVK